MNLYSNTGASVSLLPNVLFVPRLESNATTPNDTTDIIYRDTDVLAVEM